MEISPVDVHDDSVVSQLFDLHTAVHAADQPDNPALCSVSFPVRLRRDRPGTRHHRRAAVVDGRIVAHASIEQNTIDNQFAAWVNIDVHPDHRRQGIGRALMEWAIDYSRTTLGCRSLGSDTLITWNDGPKRPEAGSRFLEAMGFEVALTEVIRRVDLTEMDLELEQKLYDESLQKASAYEIVPWTGRVPDELLDGIAGINSTFLDEAPVGTLDVEAERIDADRIRQNDEISLAMGYFMCGVVARHRESGEVVANTVIGVSVEPGDHAGQWITIVSPRHRGHRLGLLIKLENHRQLRRERPAVRWVGTGNADVNAHMIAINEQLGFRPVDAERDYQLSL